MNEPLRDDPEPHRVLLPDPSREWALWRCVCVRGSGFPFSGVTRLASPVAAGAADRLNAAEDEAERLREEAVQAVGREIKTADRSAVKGLIKAIQKLKKGKAPDTAGLSAEVRAAVELYASADGKARGIRDEYLAAFAAEEERLSGELRAVARDRRFREAVLWQNRNVLKTGIDSLLRRQGDGRRSSRDRQNEQAVASYLQRFCTKNDTIGFFGPVGWARLDEGREPVSVDHGPGFLAHRRVFFEGWCVDAVADKLSSDLALRRNLAPRRALIVRADGVVMGQWAGPALSARTRAVLALCDGETSARDVAERLAASGMFADPEVVYVALDKLQDAGLLTWGFNLPMVLEPDRALRKEIERLQTGAARDAALRTLAELEAHRQAVSAAAGDDLALDTALQQMEERFTQLTGLESTRGHGETYAGRTLVYEDCRRGTELSFGPEILDELAAPLALVLASARWMTYFAAEIHRNWFEEAYRQLRWEAGSARIDLVSFCRRALHPIVHPTENMVRRHVVPRFQQLWAEVLDLPGDGSRRVTYTAEQLRPRVLRAFDAPEPGWTIARHHSPDVMIAASGLESIRRGDYQFILGEMHLGTNTLSTNLFVAQHPSPKDLVAFMARDLPEPCVFPTLPKIWQQQRSNELLGVPVAGMTGRLYFGLATAKDLYLEITPVPSGLSKEQVLSVADLSVEPGDDGLQVVSRKDGRRFDLLEFLQTAIASEIVGECKIFPARDYLPRITVDRMILARETWAFLAADLEFAQAPTESRRFAETRRWAERIGLPRLTFVKIQHERKPFFLDFQSPFSVEIFTREVRRALELFPDGARVILSEMVPGPEELWLPDRDGQRYTAELRMVAVDLTGRS